MKNSMMVSVLDDYELLVHHDPPKGYSYEQVQFKRDVIAIWLLCHRRFDYNHGAPTRTIWGFYNTKTKRYHAPVNSKTIGKEVRLEDTTPYTSMPLNLNPLMQCLMSLHQ